jgi:hypothetical protein
MSSVNQTGKAYLKAGGNLTPENLPIARLSDPFHALSRTMSHVYDTQYMLAFHPLGLPLGSIVMQYTTFD